MGSSHSVFTEEMLDEYEELTYLGRVEILDLWKRFSKLSEMEPGQELHYRIPVGYIKEEFHQLKYNPFRDRIYAVFSSLKDGCLSFDDLVDLCSAMSEKCPDKVKAAWAFRIFDFDEDTVLQKSDVMLVIDRLTQGLNKDQVLSLEEKETIVSVLMKDMDLQNSGGIGQMEFQHAVSKMSDFKTSFTFRI